MNFRIYLIKRWLRKHIFRWKDAEIIYPQIGQIVRVAGIKGFAFYREPIVFPDFAITKEDKRFWCQFVFIDNSIINATGVLWKPVLFDKEIWIKFDYQDNK